MSELPTIIRLVQAVGITASGFVAGSTLSASYLQGPLLLAAPYPTIATQFRIAYNIGKKVQPAIMLTATAAYAFLAFKLQGTLNQRKAELYGLCAVTMFLATPYTIFVMMKTNDKLIRKAEEADALKGKEAGAKITEVGLPKGESTHELVDKWTNLNVIRGLFPLAATVLGVWTSL